MPHSNERTNASWLAHRQRPGVLFTGYIYPKKQRDARDMLRRRLLLVLTCVGVLPGMAWACPGRHVRG